MEGSLGANTRNNSPYPPRSTFLQDSCAVPSPNSTRDQVITNGKFRKLSFERVTNTFAYVQYSLMGLSFCPLKSSVSIQFEVAMSIRPGSDLCMARRASSSQRDTSKRQIFALFMGLGDECLASQLWTSGIFILKRSSTYELTDVVF